MDGWEGKEDQCEEGGRKVTGTSFLTGKSLVNG